MNKATFLGITVNYISNFFVRVTGITKYFKMANASDVKIYSWKEEQILSLLSDCAIPNDWDPDIYVLTFSLIISQINRQCGSCI